MPVLSPSAPLDPQTSAPVTGCNAVRRISLTDFRSYPSLTLELDQRPVILTGSNGAGKTNLLEAISFLAPGRGLRRSRLVDVTRNDRPASGSVEWAVAGIVDTRRGPVRIGTGLESAGTRDNETSRRVVRIDGEPVKNHANLSDILGMVWIVPELDRLFADAASGRRRFLDRLVAGFDPSHATRLNQYDKSVRERNSLLRTDRFGTGTADGEWLGALERRIAEYGVAVAAARCDFVQRFAGIHPETQEFPRASVSLIGEPETWLHGNSALDAEDRLTEALAASRERDREAGRTQVGPHRSDMVVVHAEKNTAAADCSTGEQKALVIGIVLAYTKLLTLDRGATPLLLLDEIGAHLDARRRAALFAEIRRTGAQAWMTGTDTALFRGFGDDAQHLIIENSKVQHTRN